MLILQIHKFFSFHFRRQWPVWILFIFGSIITAQDFLLIKSVSLDVKRNGLFIQVKGSRKINTRDVTGWQANNNWFYITVMNAQADSVKVEGAKIIDPVQEIQAININESVQLGFKLSRKIEYYEIYPSDITPGMILSLHFPVKEVVAALQEEKDDDATVTAENIPLVTAAGPPVDEVSLSASATRMSTFSYRNTRNSCYLLGFMLTASGLMEAQAERRTQIWETQTGLALISLTFIYDKFIRKTPTVDE